MSDPVTIGGAIGSGLGIGFGIAKAMSRWLPARNTNGHHRAPCADLIDLKSAVAVQTRAIEDLGDSLSQQMKQGFEAVNTRIADQRRNP